MMTYIEINETRYPASIGGKMSDRDWDGRASKTITLDLSYNDAVSIFTENVKWYIVQEHEVQNEEGETILETEKYDNSEYNIPGDIVDHRNGTVSVKMGKPTAEEILAIILGER